VTVATSCGMRHMIVALLLLASAMPGITEGDVPLTDWCESAGIPGPLPQRDVRRECLMCLAVVHSPVHHCA
jgi:hypothetical protein